MKQLLEKKFIFRSLAALALLSLSGMTELSAQRFRHVNTGGTPVRTVTPARNLRTAAAKEIPVDSSLLRNQRIALLRSELAKALADSVAADTLHRRRSVNEILEQTPLPSKAPTAVNKVLGPWVFSGYRSTYRKPGFLPKLNDEEKKNLWLDARDSVTVSETREIAVLSGDPDSVIMARANLLTERYTMPQVMTGDVTPTWLRDAMQANRLQENFIYNSIIDNPGLADYAYWDLPVPPRLPEEDYSIHAYIKSMNLPPVKVDDTVISGFAIDKRHWLHTLNMALQFSQAFMSRNWYQGGNNYLSLLGNFYWDVQLNQVYHPKLMFQSTLSYKLGLNSVQDDEFRNYSISEDLFQYNVKFGYKAAHNWYYSVTGQFKTQLLNNYKKNTNTRIASFLTPGELNFGLGMTYSHQNKKKTFTLNASIAPVSYNLKTAISQKIDHGLFKIDQDKRSVSDIGSNGELTVNWQIWKNVNYKSRLFVFTDYGSFLGDWQNTLEFQFNRFFSTQIYANLRYDSEVDPNKSPGWNKWMLKEILSIGLSYTFATKSK